MARLRCICGTFVVFGILMAKDIAISGKKLSYNQDPLPKLEFDALA
jgi:hypothetical protein